MPGTAAQRQKQHKDRERAKAKESRLFAEIITDRISDEDRITLKIERTADSH